MLPQSHDARLVEDNLLAMEMQRLCRSHAHEGAIGTAINQDPFVASQLDKGVLARCCIRWDHDVVGGITANRDALFSVADPLGSAVL